MTEPTGLSASVPLSRPFRRAGACSPWRMAIGVASLLLLSQPSAWSQEIRQSQFIGTWCSNPCGLGSTSRPWDLPCSFVISDAEIRWSQWDDQSSHNVRSYVVVEQKEGEETMLVHGGSALVRSCFDIRNRPESQLATPGAAVLLTLQRRNHFSGLHARCPSSS